MKELLEYLVKNLVSNPDSVVVEEDNQDGNVNIYLTVHPDDMGIIIGKGGQTIHALRKILTVRAIAENVRVNLQLNEPSPSAEATGDREDSDKSPAEGEARQNRQESRVKEEESEVTEEQAPEETEKEKPEEGESEEK